MCLLLNFFVKFPKGRNIITSTNFTGNMVLFRALIEPLELLTSKYQKTLEYQKASNTARKMMTKYYFFKPLISRSEKRQSPK